MAASTSALPPHLPARREADVIWQLLFAAKPANCGPCVLRPEPGGESAGCVACRALFSRLCLPAVLFCRLLFACHSLPAMPTALLNILPPFSLLCPVHCAFACHLFIPCAPGSPFRRAGDLFQIGPAVCKLLTVPLAAATRACSGGPCTGPFFDSFFFLQSPFDPGPWVSVEYKAKLFVVNMCASPGMSYVEPGNVVKSSA